eukprot:365725-Chlamydomonas_euryale.AAC.41
MLLRLLSIFPHQPRLAAAGLHDQAVLHLAATKPWQQHEQGLLRGGVLAAGGSPCFNNTVLQMAQAKMPLADEMAKIGNAVCLSACNQRSSEAGRILCLHGRLQWDSKEQCHTCAILQRQTQVWLPCECLHHASGHTRLLLQTPPGRPPLPAAPWLPPPPDQLDDLAAAMQDGGVSVSIALADETGSYNVWIPPPVGPMPVSGDKVGHSGGSAPRLGLDDLLPNSGARPAPQKPPNLKLGDLGQG